MNPATIQMMNEKIKPFVVQLDINRIKKILKNRKEDNAALDIVQNKIDKVFSNSSGIISSVNKTKMKQSNFIKGKHGEKKSKTVRPKNVLTKNKKIKAITDFELEKCIRKNNRKRKHHCEIKSKCKYRHLKMNMDGLKDVPNEITHPEIKQIYSKDNATNINNNLYFINLYGDETSFSIPNDTENVPILVTKNKTPSEIVIIDNNTKMDEFYMSKKSIQINFSEKKLNGTLSSSILDVIVVSDDDDDVIINGALPGSVSDIISISSSDDNDYDVDVITSNTTNVDESIKRKKTIQTHFSEKKLNDALSSSIPNIIFVSDDDVNTTNVNEFNKSKKSLKTNLSGKKLNDALSSSISDITDFVLDSKSDTTDINFDYTKDEKYKTLSYIVFLNFNIYDKQIMIEFGQKLRKDNLLEELNDTWDLSKADIVKSILENILKLIFDMENKSIIFMGCLSSIFRKTINDLDKISYKQLYDHFIKYTDVIKKCLNNINDHFWKTVLPNGWNVFCNGCLIVDVILFGSTLSLVEYVNWKEIPQCDVSITPNISDITTEKAVSSIGNTITAYDGEPILRKRSFSSMSSTSNKLSLTSDEILAKKKKLDNV